MTKPAEYRIEWVPFHERGPIAAFQLEAVNEAGVYVPEGMRVLPLLDASDCMALVATLEDGGQRLDALVYLNPSFPTTAVLMLYWVRRGTPAAAVNMVNVGLDDWMVSNKVTSIRGGVRHCPMGFRKTGIQMVERVLEPEEEA